MSWLSNLLGKRSDSSESLPNDNLPSFPIWLEQQGNVSVQDGLDCYIQQFMSFEPVDLTSSHPKTIEERTRDLEIQRAEVTLLEECRTFYGENSMSPEFDDLLSTKKLSLQMAEDSLEMKLRSERAIREARKRISSRDQPPSP